MSDIKNRVKKLEQKQPPESDFIAVDWGEDTITVNGEQLTREEFDRRYPRATRIVVEYEDGSWHDEEG